jgi:hypothetical protein
VNASDSQNGSVRRASPSIQALAVSASTSLM